MATIKVEEIKNGMPGITTAIGEYLYENILIGMHLSNHSSGVTLTITGLIEEMCTLSWDGICTSQMLRAYADHHNVTEEAAVGLSLLLTREFTDYTIVERSWTGTGIDYWLGYKDDPLFTRAARLEISGIMVETTSNNITTRLKVKEQQIQKSDYTSLPAYISIVELGTPKALFHKQS